MLESAKRFMRRWLSSTPSFVLLGLVLGALISIPAITKPVIATMTISGTIVGQAHVDDISAALRYAGDSSDIKAVVLQIDSPGGEASLTEQLYLDLLQLRQKKPVVVAIGARGASGGYYIAVASNFIYAEPTSQLGSIGAWLTLPQSESLSEDIITSGPFKASGGPKRKYIGVLETFRQQFVDAVISQRGDRLKIAEEELSQAEIYTGTESLRYGLIDGIGTSSAALEKAASLAHVRNYDIVELQIQQPTILFFSLETLKSQAGTMPVYYYLYFESR
jgi:protease-4